MDGLKKTGTNLRQDTWYKGQDFNPGPLDHEARMLPSTHDACVEKILSSDVTIHFNVRRDFYNYL